MDSFLKSVLMVYAVHMVVSKTTSTAPSKYVKLDVGESVAGTRLAVLNAKYQIQCSVSCLLQAACFAYQYNPVQDLGSCLLIGTNTTDDETSFNTTNEAGIFKTACDQEAIVSLWTPPNRWTGPQPVRYWSFDIPGCLVLKEGSLQTNIWATTAGKLRKAVITNHLKRQWVDLGIHNEACMIRPETCDAAGGAISVWIKLNDCGNWCGIISSFSGSATGFELYCRHTAEIRFFLYLLDGQLTVYIHDRKSKDWTHVILNYEGSDDHGRVSVYFNGTLVGSDGTRDSSIREATRDGRMVIGRKTTDTDTDYASLEMDELVLFNAALTEDEIQALSTYV